ncbi:lipopolysaccharide export system permease protein [Mucilaginibacter yixingensis]|uniref:Lipopolysaccharide export system permease protein n=1 Tax=Mucilaginibacter yixingensis TaxID=1295612 RepID=A0A2T5JG24_9SPHI|nr:LptF/LptG family permease [Mucilaginibacter yixingensis]PTR01344.1 lipopolysaccharide export system permease protein [Mucilaginibacter yixingensis]
MSKFINRYLKVIDRYIMRKYLGTFVFTLVIFSVITVVFDISERLDNFLKGGASLRDIICEYYAGFVPFYLNMLSPLINFLAVIFFTAKMANQTEIVPILSGKASFNRFLRPYFLSATLIFIVSLFVNVYLIPYTNRLMNNFANVYFNDVDPTRSETHIQLNKETFVYLQSYDETIHMGYNFILEKFKGDEMREKLTAPTIRFDSVKHSWSIPQYQVRYVNGLRESMKTGYNKDTVLDMKPTDFVLRDNVYQAISTRALAAGITKEKERGTGLLIPMQFEMYKRFVYPMSTFVLTLIGVSISSRKVRGGIGLPLGIGIFLCFTYIVVDRFAFVFSIKGGMPPGFTVFIPNVLFGILGLFMLRKAPK